MAKIHPPLMGRFWLRYALAGMQGFNFARVNSMEDILDLDLSVFCGMVLYFHHKKISVQALDTFDEFVSGGGGCLRSTRQQPLSKMLIDLRIFLGGKFSADTDRLSLFL